MDAFGLYFFIYITVSIMAELEAVTVSTSLCLTNKVSPRRNKASSSSASPRDDGTGRDTWTIRNPRTLDLAYDLLGPARSQRQLDLFSDLQEQLQEDRDDCGGRQGFGKKDLSSITQNNPTKNSERKDRKYTIYNHPPYNPGLPIRTSRPPQKPTGSSDHFEGHIKPVWEYILEPPQPTYRPDLIGGPLAYIVGISSRRPPTEDPPTEGPLTEDPLTEDQLKIKESSAPIRFPENNNSSYTTRQKKPQRGKSTSLVRSFVDLLLN